MGHSKVRLGNFLNLYKDYVSAFHMKSVNAGQYVIAMAKLVFWSIVVILIALFLRYYLDTPVPEEIPEKFRVQVIDASFRTYKHLVSDMYHTIFIIVHKYTTKLKFRATPEESFSVQFIPLSDKLFDFR